MTCYTKECEKELKRGNTTGYCLTHFNENTKRVHQGCSVEGCENEHRTNGLCKPHYNQNRRKGKTFHAKETRTNKSVSYEAAQKRLAFLRCLRDAGWTEERFIAFNYAQGGLCYLCGDVSYQNGKPMRLCADHDHKTDEPRGLLCQRCNQFLWFYENQDMAIAAEKYLRR